MKAKNKNGRIDLKAKTREQLALEFGVSIRTFQRWLKKVELEIPSGLICPKHLTEIYEEFGHPKQLD